MQEEASIDFYERVTQGTKDFETITIEHRSGSARTFEVHPVSKRQLARTISKLPDELFDQVEDVDDPENADEEVEMSISALTEETIEAFEEICAASLKDPADKDPLSPSQIADIVQAFDFEVLFRVGTMAINLSVEETGVIRDFHEQE